METAILNESIRICNFIGASVNGSKVEYTPTEFAVWFAEYNKIVTLLYSALNSCDKADGVYQKLANLAERELLKQLRNDVLQEKICKEFKQRGIFHLVLKGSETRLFYPESLMRTSNDIDIYVSPESIDEAKTVLEGMGLKYVKENSGGEDFEFNLGGSYVELHISLGGITKRQKQFFARVAEKASKAKNGLTRENQYIYTVFHLYKHFITAGAGARMFLDVYCINKAGLEDRKYIESALEKLDILRFEATVTKINEILFEFKNPDKESLELLEYIFENGAYGTSAAAKHLKYASARVVEQASVGHILNDLCLDKASMQRRYPILKKCIALYPLCVLHRTVKGVIFRKKTLAGAVSSAKDVVLNRERYSRILKISGIL